MAIDIVEFDERWEAAVARFNARLRGGGSRWGWYQKSAEIWLPRLPGRRVWREHFLAVENQSEVRGAYALKPQDFRIRGKTQIVTDWQGPVSEGIVDQKYAALGLRLFRDMLKRRPLLYSWGTGGLDHSMPRMMQSLGFELVLTPFLLRVLRPARFLRLNRYLRSSAFRRLGFDLLAVSGIGSVSLAAIHSAIELRNRRSEPAHAELVPEFGSWCDALWERHADRYAATAVRDSAMSNALWPASGWPRGFRLRVRRNADDIGWAVVTDNQMSGDARFGDLRVGSIADGFAAPDDAEAVVGAALEWLRRRDVDLVVSNQSHPSWIAGFAAHGFVALEGRRAFAVSPALRAILEPLDEIRAGLHLTLIDGHGPHGV